MVLSLLVAGAGLGDGPWVSGLVLGASLWSPAFPGETGGGRPLRGFTGGGVLTTGEHRVAAAGAGSFTARRMALVLQFGGQNIPTPSEQ